MFSQRGSESSAPEIWLTRRPGLRERNAERLRLWSRQDSLLKSMHGGWNVLKKSGR
jgi:hypothetical protein